MEAQVQVMDNQGDTQEFISNKINKARLETRQLYQQIDKVKAKIQDSTLTDCAANVPSLSKSSLNLKPLQVLKGHNNKVSDIKWAADSKSILSCSQDGFLIIWDPVTGMKLNAIPLDSQWVLSCAYSPNGKLVASAGLTNNCTVYSVPNLDDESVAFQQRIVCVFKGHVCGITACDFINNNSILTASGDLTCSKWDITKGKRVGEYLDHFGDVLAMTIDQQSLANGGGDCIFASGASDGYARIWDTRNNGRVSQQFFVSNSDITSVRFFPDGNSFATGSDDGIIRLYDLRADCELAKYSLPSATQQLRAREMDQTYFHQSPLYEEQVMESKNSRTFSIEELNSTLDVSGVMSLDFSKSGRLMYSSYAEQGCFIWDTLKAEVVGKLEGHSNRVTKVSTSPNGYAVCTSSWDSTMRVWTPSYV
jgi:guanine nucleotide-binding protein G(I)/G(S)/G(T) subunit beta-1